MTWGWERNNPLDTDIFFNAISVTLSEARQKRLTNPPQILDFTL